MENNKLKEKVLNNVKENIAISNIRDEININNSRNKKIFYSTLPTCAMIFACAIVVNSLNQEKSANRLEDFGTKEEIVAKDGVTIPDLEFPNPIEDSSLDSLDAIEDSTQKNLTAENCRAYLIIQYGENRYISTDRIDIDKAGNLKGKYLGKTDNGKDKVYEVNGYSTLFRICKVDEVNNQIQIYERLNGITLKYGKDLYEDRLKLKRKLQ